MYKELDRKVAGALSVHADNLELIAGKLRDAAKLVGAREFTAEQNMTDLNTSIEDQLVAVHEALLVVDEFICTVRSTRDKYNRGVDLFHGERLAYIKAHPEVLDEEAERFRESLKK
jgi:hypothetical protein